MNDKITDIEAQEIKRKAQEERGKFQQEVAEIVKNAPSLENLRTGQTNRFDKPPTQKDKASQKKVAKYLKRINEPNIISTEAVLDKLISRPQKTVKQLMDYDRARLLVYKVAMRKLQEDAKEGQKPKLVMQNEDAANLWANLTKYFAGIDSCLDLKKGILLASDVGIGKTFIMEVMKAFCESTNHTYRQFRIKSCSSIQSGFLASENGFKYLEQYYTGDWLFDDLGVEAGMARSYGNAVVVMEQILTQRHERFLKGKCITHITTNLSMDEIGTRYGSRIADRFRQTMNIIPLEGKSLRR